MNPRPRFYLIPCFFLAVTVCACDWRDDSEVTVYPATCDGTLKNGKCCGKIIPLNRDVYKVSSARQDVIYWSPGIWEEPRRLVNCIVRDAKNWSGEYPDGSGKVKMVNGKFYEEAPEVEEMRRQAGINTFYISQWRWWYIEIAGAIKSLLK